MAAGSPYAAPLIALGGVLVGSLGIPIPTFAALVFAGSLAARAPGGLATAAAIVAAGTAIAITCDTIWFLVGRKHGLRILGLLCRLSLSRDSCVRRTADIFMRQGLKFVLVVRFLPGLAMLSPPLAGASGVGLGRFLATDAVGAAGWITIGLAAGYEVAEQVGTLLAVLRRFGVDLGGALLAVTMIYAVYMWIRRQLLLRQLRMARMSPEELQALMLAGDPLVILDVRTRLDQQADPFLIPGAKPFQDLDLKNLPFAATPPRPVVIYCACPNEVSAAAVARQLRKLGFTDVRPLRGGIDAWRQAGLPLEAARVSAG